MTEQEGVARAVGAIELRAAERRRRRRLRIVGAALVAYGVAGILLFGALAAALGGPIEQATDLAESLEEQRSVALDALEQASETIRQTAAGVRGMEPSLAQSRAATDRAASIAQGVAGSMFGLSNAMQLTIFGAQPLIGLAISFEQTGAQLQLLSGEVAAIGAALEANTEDVRTVALSMDEMGASVDALIDSIREGPRLELSLGTLGGLRLAVFAVLGWLLLLALGSVAAGAYLFWLTRRREPAA